ncbi:hypothetical protein HOLleu_25699 [Holothuria leucospilota]|uniref:G-protein coupled receptors family 1 profile domain-containing protein n=1 Tax=Holothuria leucospilota TaxID=206669 RepID=A0A9Q1BT04_HOLLE|nr:hypothetical protein HOLleu_25699 [Holothuria leucospilota]
MVPKGLNEQSKGLFKPCIGQGRPERNGRVMNASPVSENQVNITKNLFYLFVTFLMCFGPAVVSEAFSANVIVLSYTRAIIAFNSCLNPAIYGIKHPLFRQVMYNILFRKWSEIPEPAFKWMNSEVPCPAGSRSKDLDAISITVSEKSTVV